MDTGNSLVYINIVTRTVNMDYESFTKKICFRLNASHFSRQIGNNIDTNRGGSFEYLVS